MTASQTPIPTPALPNKHREDIDWNENYGQTFKAVIVPEELELIEDKTMIVTPKNKVEWATWNEVSEKHLCTMKKNWYIIQKNLTEHKYQEILSYIKNLEKTFV